MGLTAASCNGVISDNLNFLERLGREAWGGAGQFDFQKENYRRSVCYVSVLPESVKYVWRAIASWAMLELSGENHLTGVDFSLQKAYRIFIKS